MAQTSTIAQLAPAVGQRLQDDTFVFWLEQFEVYAALAEGISEAMLILGRPQVQFNLPVILQPNVCWQPMPANCLALVDVRLAGRRLNKTTLRSMDVLCASWSSNWESDRAAQPARWFPVGLSMFGVHPAPLQPIQVDVTAITYPIQTAWPPSGAEQSPFEVNFDQALQMAATAYCRQKEGGQDAEEGMPMYQAFLEICQRMSGIQDRCDSLVWTRSLGAPTAPSG